MTEAELLAALPPEMHGEYFRRKAFDGNVFLLRAHDGTFTFADAGTVETAVRNEAIASALGFAHGDDFARALEMAQEQLDAAPVKLPPPPIGAAPETILEAET